MALTVAEANAVHTVIYKLVDLADADRYPTELEMREALMLLADHAHARLGAGPTGVEVRAQWGSR